MVVFSLYITKSGTAFYAGVTGLLAAAAVMFAGLAGSGSVAGVLGLSVYNKRLAWFLGGGIVLGLSAALSYRYSVDWPLLPHTLTTTALVSPLIGLTEELVFRGYLQGRVGRIGPLGAASIAAAAHTVYKYLVIRSYSGEASSMFHLDALVLFTFVFGLIAGLLREYGRNVLPALLAHMVFDLMVYGSFIQMPNWVWG